MRTNILLSIGKRKSPCYLSLIIDVYSEKIVGFNHWRSFKRFEHGPED
ncbi:hypothetical protein HZQ24_15115 [Elizabethkingia anophelis]|nr:hypothetical protein [Elizabethkingia anophelis]MCT3646232.1 hypothetical protein [Elizabethkingia anophelis]MCT3647318.1 hypothetical protein [Elizabethkingia anophelis]MCT4013673.1 hypothetical protein [Elizabethkingia anophelis]MCT4205578.1 hypothetical protein [Elizabethkingia anophelis]MCT4209092.1 hypothetical protein [Elizabethkingia anophelis]